MWLLFIGLVLSSCAPSYPARTMTIALPKLIQDEYQIKTSCHIVGRTLWVYVPLENLVDEEKMSWSSDGLETMGKAIGVAHRVILSTDAKFNFLCVVAVDVKKFGVELNALEYVPDVKEAVLEKFSRGDFFSRSVRDIAYRASAIGDLTGEKFRYYDISFDEFLMRQIIHRAKSLFVKDKKLEELFDLKTTAWDQKFGILKMDFEFIRKKYGLKPEDENLDPLVYVQMLCADSVKNYDYKTFQEIQLTDTFTDKTLKLTPEDLKKTKINLPKIDS